LQLLTEEYSQMSPNTMEVQGFTNQREYDKIWALTKPASPDTTRKITGFLNMVKDRADEKFTNVTSTGMCKKLCFLFISFMRFSAFNSSCTLLIFYSFS